MYYCVYWLDTVERLSLQRRMYEHTQIAYQWHFIFLYYLCYNIKVWRHFVHCTALSVLNLSVSIINLLLPDALLFPPP